MQNCLIEKLNGTVDYKDFPRVGYLRIKVEKTSKPSEANSYIRMAYDGVAANAEIVGDGYFMRTYLGESKGKQQVAELYGSNYEMRDVYISEGSFVLEYSDKYDLKYLGTGQNGERYSINLEDLAYCKKLQHIELQSCAVEGDISNLAKMNGLKNVLLSYSKGTKIYGDTSVIRDNSFPNLEKFSIESSNVGGDISDFANCKLLNTLHTQFSGVKGTLSSIGGLTKITAMNLSSGIEGTIESFVQAQRAAGRKTCSGITSQYLYSCTKITFAGKPLQDTVGVEYMSKISWTETTITVKDATITA